MTRRGVVLSQPARWDPLAMGRPSGVGVLKRGVDPHEAAGEVGEPPMSGRSKGGDLLSAQLAGRHVPLHLAGTCS
ncbi:hypothetical protein NDU88_008257 [Pleurodeles waltl]|uniref:Uncharacterized protein n=1 Tax=Pleurodeles waltl TaxID=8319 RepID=A0AAV7RUR0_PLEWA|nr:hypothetical protein NDU88_008257 [Pleurodeles waltl]